MSKIYWSLGMIAFLGAMVVGGTGAFFGDTETSTGNTFAAGAIDLKIDNESYYNSNVCAPDTDDVNNNENVLEYVWQGDADYPVEGTICDTSFPKADLDDGFVFFDFDDLKPDDEGEDTISIHVQNDAWACMDLTLTSDDDKSSNEPELGDGDVAENPGNAWDGELAQTLEFLWWADDGDNVYEDDEPLISDGVQTLAELAPQGDSFSVTLADAENNAWGEPDGTPLPGGDTVYIAKAWCMGTLVPASLEQDGFDDQRSPNDEEGPGVDCDGTLLDNKTQTDGVELNVVFSAVQARNNDDFLCNPREEEDPVTLTVNKILTVDHGDEIVISDFALHIDGPIPGPVDDIIVGDNAPNPGLPAGTYTVYEVIVGDVSGATFTTTFGGACDPITHQVTLAPGESKICTINNVENEGLPVSPLQP